MTHLAASRVSGIMGPWFGQGFYSGKGDAMARSCEICGKGFSMGNSVTIRGKQKYLGGVGTKITGITRRKFKPNLQRIRVTLPSGENKTMLVCTQCIRSGRVTKLVRQKPFHLPKVEKSKSSAEETVPAGPRARP